MRTAFINELIAAARLNPHLVLLTGDLGYTVFEPFREEFADRYFNVGVSEANMIGVAAGLAKLGKKPFVYSIIPFGTLRCFEQIRLDICYHNLPVTVVGVGAGYSYGDMGATHHSLEDIAVMRSLPNMTVVCPGDPAEAAAATRALAVHPGPAYLRLGKKGEPPVHAGDPDFRLGKAIMVRDGRDIALLATSNMLYTTLRAANLLRERHLEPAVVSIHTIKPLDVKFLEQLAGNFAKIYTIEEHSVIGGLGSAVSEILMTLSTRPQIVRIGIPDTFVHESGSHQYLRERIGLTPEAISQRVLSNKS